MDVSMSGELTYSGDELEALSGKLASATRAIGDKLSDLETESERLAGSWSGEAQAAYERARREWARAFGDLNASLSRFSAAVVDARQQFDATDAQNSRSWNS
jgi:WXG100 family type VII secretion target